MVEDVQVAQALLLVRLLREQIIDISSELEAAENRTDPHHVRGRFDRQQREVSLRRQLYEAYRLIDGLHRRFPDTVDRSQTGAVDTPRRPAVSEG